MAKVQTLYQKLRRKRVKVTQPVALAAKAFVGVPDPLACTVRCPTCRGEAVWFSARTESSAPIDAEAARTCGVKLTRRFGDWVVWHFPTLIPPDDDSEYSTAFDKYSVHALYRSRRFSPDVIGARHCPTCKTLIRAALNWPQSAYYQVTFKGIRLYAINRADWMAIRRYIAADNRRELQRAEQTHWSVRYLPATIISANNRAAVLKAIDKVIGAPTGKDRAETRACGVNARGTKGPQSQRATGPKKSRRSG